MYEVPSLIPGINKIKTTQNTMGTWPKFFIHRKMVVSSCGVSQGPARPLSVKASKLQSLRDHSGISRDHCQLVSHPSRPLPPKGTSSRADMLIWGEIFKLICHCSDPNLLILNGKALAQSRFRKLSPLAWADYWANLQQSVKKSCSMVD